MQFPISSAGLNHGYPVMLRMDNRSEFNTLALTLAEWA